LVAQEQRAFLVDSLAPVAAVAREEFHHTALVAGLALLAGNDGKTQPGERAAGMFYLLALYAAASFRVV
jgi:hypothetical protein